MKGAGVQYLIVIEMVVRMEKECKNTNEEENMKKNVKKVISFILSMLVIISTAVTPAMAAGTKEAPTEVKSVTASGLWTTVLNLEFEDTTWMDNINKVIVNDKECKKSTINSFSSDTNIWEVGSAMGAYGSYKALKLAVPDGKLWTVKVSADGYKDLTVKITKETVNYTDTYKAEVVSNSGETTNKTYTADVTPAVNGKITLSAAKDIKEGDTVTVTAAPDENYEVVAVTVKGVSGKSVDVQNAEGIYTFKMPAENVTVSATFKEKAIAGNKKIEVSQVSINKDLWGSDWEFTFKNAEDYVSAITDVKVNGTLWEEKSYSVSSGGQYYKNTSSNKLVCAAGEYSANPTIPVLKSGDIITITANGYEDLTFKLVIKDGNASLVEDDGQGDPYDLHVKIDGSFEAAIVGQKNYDGVSSASVGGSSSNKNSSVKVYGALVNKGTEPADNDWEELDNLSKIKLDGSKCKVDIVPDTANGTPADSDSGMKGVYMTISSNLTLNGTPKDAGTYLVSVSITDDQGRTAVSNTLPFRVYSGDETLAERLKEENFKKYDSGLYAWDIMEPWAISKFGTNVEGEEESVRVPAGLEAWFGSKESGTYGYLGYDLPWKKVMSGDIPQTLYIPNGCNLTLTNMEILSSVRIVVENGGKLTLSDSVVQGIIDVQSGGTFSMNYDAYKNAFTTGSSICGQLRLADGAILVTTGGEGMINENDGGTAIDIKSGKITGNGKLVAIGGKTFWGNGGNAVTGNGTIETASAFLQGATASKAKNKEAGKAIGDNIRVITSDRYIKDGEVSDNYGTDDALSGLYWKEGIDATPPLDKYVTSEVENILSLEGTLDKTYDGKAVNGPVVKAGDKVLAEETDYTLTYKDSEGNELSETPVNAGTYTVTVNGLGTYAGMNLNVTFTISPKAAELTVVADPSSAKYDGKSKTPEVTVKDGDKVLKEGTDYTLSYVYGEDAETKDFAGAEFVKEGNYTITVTGIGNYEGSTGKAVFTISKNNSASTDPTNPSNPNGDKKVTDKKVSNNTNNVKPVVKNVAAKNNKNVPKTGDNANVLLWIALAVISCGVLAGAGVAVRKRK